MSRGAELAITTTVLGTTKAPMLRRGARANDGLYVSGPLGHAALGLEALARGRHEPRFDDYVARWRRPRLCTGASLEHASAGLDVSDGLTQDLAHLLEGTRLGAQLDATALVDDAFRHAAEVLGLDPLALALGGGEDYVLLCASALPVEGFVRIGTVTQTPGFTLVDRDGAPRALQTSGHVHRL